MAWHLKDKELEQKLIGIDTDFSERLNQLCEKWDSNKDGDLCKYKKFSVPFYRGDKLHGEVTFLGDEVEKINEYNPNAWNEYPKLTPENELMRIECYDGTCGEGIMLTVSGTEMVLMNYLI